MAPHQCSGSQWIRSHRGSTTLRLQERLGGRANQSLSGKSLLRQGNGTRSIPPFRRNYTYEGLAATTVENEAPVLIDSDDEEPGSQPPPSKPKMPSMVDSESIILLSGQVRQGKEQEHVRGRLRL